MAENTPFSRPPIVAVLGHVDHGKTSLLDRIRNTSVASREAGGITQSIGAWQITSKEGRKVTFIDTPGHAAFNQMRSRGAKLSDIAILVVAADDGIMPQTKESLEYLREAKTPFIVAITKTDLATAQPEVVKNQLAKEQVFLEGRGGDVTAVEVSSQTGKGIDELLEIITLTTDLLEVRSDPQGEIEAIVIETGRDAKRGSVVSCILRNGTIRIGSQLYADSTEARVRGLFDEHGKPVKEAGPGTPVEILGFDALPAVGAVITSLKPGVANAIPISSKTLSRKKREGFWIILKADTAGSLEAIQGQLNAKIGISSASIGDVIDSDVVMASSTGSPIVGFNVRVSREIQKLADEENVKVYTYRIIYELLSNVDKWQKELEALQNEKILGKAQVIAQFPHAKETRIAGCRLESGRIVKTDKLRLIREDKVLGTVRVLSLKQQKQEVDKVDSGEFGIHFEPQLDFRIGDTIEAFIPPKSPAN